MAKETKECPNCGAPMKVRDGRKGPFWGCTAYPECQYTENVDPALPEEMTQDVVAAAKKRFDLAAEFILACGGYKAASEAIRAAASVMSTCKAGEGGQ